MTNIAGRVSRDGRAHTSEPWTIEPAGQHVELKIQSAVILDGRRHVLAAVRTAKDARRIVACINACQGIPTEALEGGALAEAVGSLADLARYIDAKPWGSTHPGRPHRIMDAARAALAKLRGEG